MSAAAESQGVEKTCVECGEAKGKVTKGTFRCSDCNSLKSRLHRLLSKDGMESQSQLFKALPKDERMEFFKNSANMMGKDLASAVDEHITRTSKRESETGFIGTGEWLDEHDLREKYKHKGEQATNIMENSRKVMDPVRKVWLFEDMTYKSSVSRSEKLSEVHEQSVSQSSKLKKEKKVVKAEPVSQDSSVIEIEKAMHLLGIVSKPVAECMEEVKEHNLTEYISQPVMSKFVTHHLMLKELQASAEILKESEQLTDEEAKRFGKQVQDQKLESKEVVRCFKLQLNAAKAAAGVALTKKVSKRKAEDEGQPEKKSRSST